MKLLDILLVILLISWLGGFSLRLGGSLIHLILVVAVIIFLARLLGL
ncbi:MAG: lmo0937 family membrane protein [Candidatus Shapirobacteria bacterium]|jgi:hypothetical protein